MNDFKANMIKVDTILTKVTKNYKKKSISTLVRVVVLKMKKKKSNSK